MKAAPDRVFTPSRVEAFSDGVLAIVFWVNHHRLFTLIRKVDWGMLWLNNLLLLLLSFVPFPTAFVGDHPRNPLALALFALVLMSAGIAFNLMWRHGRRNHLTEKTLTVERINRAIRRGLYGPMAYAIAAVAAFLAVPVSWFIFLAVPVYYAFPTRDHDPTERIIDKESTK